MIGARSKFTALFQSGGKTWFYAALLLSSFLLPACSSTNIKHDHDYEQPLIEKQIKELDDKLDEIYHRVSLIQFMVDNHERTLKDLENKYGLKRKSGSLESSGKIPPLPIVEETFTPEASSVSPVIIQEKKSTQKSKPLPPGTMYKNAFSLYKDSKFKKAELKFKSFLTKYPNHDLADNALYWIGECRYSQKNFTGAIDGFKSLALRYPEGNKVPDALLKTGYAYLLLKDRTNAVDFFKKLVKKYPFSPAGEKAEKILNKLK